MAHVFVCLPVVSLEETSIPSVQLPPPATALTAETQSQSAPPCLPTFTPAGDTRTSFLVYLSLPAPELANTPSLVCQLCLGPEGKSLPFLSVPMTSADIPRAPSLVASSPAPAQTAALAAVSEIPRTPCFVTNLPGVTGIPRSTSYVAAGAQVQAQEPLMAPSYLANTTGIQAPQRTPSYDANTAGVQESPSRSLIKGHCLVCRPFSLYPQGAPGIGHSTHSPG